ncbi:metal-dependent hydrolase [Brachybacterium endophyticum]|uniref:Metal-dependent hydrolase n=1 Tax=Brachybacterium endophyticum TaxID=2182385 RepID=A0A2U2RHF8_9MICO|nr:MBL fold metallo-hydrolase [Brachybacterium endophyticum]PWH05261.1 metal-dependent hydrolase [Brachybacterium endophyticum]
MRLTVIGCCGSFAGPTGTASSYLLEQEDETGRTWRVLMDLGSGAFGPLQAQIDPATLDAVVISHLHPDHFLDLTGLEVFWAYNSRELPRLPIHAPDGLAQRLRSVLGREGDVPDGVTCLPFDHRPIHDGQDIEIGPFHFEIGAVRHTVPSYGMRVSAGGSVLTYSGDTDTCDRLLELARDADVLLCEAGYIEGRDDRFSGVHLTGSRAGEAATAAGARSLVLTHIAPWTDPAVSLAETRETYHGPITMAEPALVVETETVRASH